ncbi:MAG: recombination-associated protein RdgC [Myxococcales bacterium]|nr:recombination-associated protein RdgC [Myxococcales bacterium]
MGLLANTVSVAQFAVNGKPPQKDFAVWAEHGLSRFCFRAIDETTDEESQGWVTLDDNLSADFGNHYSFLRDHYLVATLRRDRRKPPAFLLRRLFARECEQWLQAHPGQQRVPTQARLEIRDRVTFELRARTLPTPTTIDLVWNLERGLVTATTTAAKSMDLIQDEFAKTFPGLTLTALHPAARAKRVADKKLHRALDEANPAFDQDVATQLKANRWIGNDLLLWLMHRTRHSDSAYEVGQPGPAAAGDAFIAYVNDRLVFQDEDEHGVRKSAFTGHLKDFAEARKAAQVGKQPTEATLHFEKGELAWKLTLKAESFAFASYKCPGVRIEKDETTDPAAERDAVFFERLHLLETGIQLFDSLLAVFITARMGEDWEKTMRAIRRTLGE